VAATVTVFFFLDVNNAAPWSRIVGMAAAVAASVRDPDVWDDPLTYKPRALAAAVTTTATAAAAVEGVLVRTPAAAKGPGLAARSLWVGSPPQAARAGVSAEQEEAVGARVRAAFDAGTSRVDLSELGLEALPAADILSLRWFTPALADQGRGHAQGLGVYLSRNALAVFPRLLLSLGDTLTVLSLRANKLDRLPPELRVLRHLRELSVGGNQLPYLPWELTTLPHLRTVHAQPNPFQASAPAPVPVPVPSLRELCLRAAHRAGLVPPVSAEFAGADAEKRPHDHLAPYLRAAPVLGTLPIEVAAAAVTRCWCAHCDMIMATPTVERVVWVAPWGAAPPVALQYRYCSAACARA
jgi:hypothetical protein